MSVQLKTMAIKARLANHIRKTLYKRKLQSISDQEKVSIFNEIYSLNYLMHWDLINYKEKRRNKRELLEKRRAAPKTKSMMKKLFPKKVSLEQYKKNLESSK